MADDNNEDSWLYGTSNPDSTTNDEDDRNETAALERFLQNQETNEVEQFPTEKDITDNHDTEEHDPTDDFEEDPAHQMEVGEISVNDDPKDPGDSSSDDSEEDDINVVIGDIKSAPTGTYNIKQRQLPAGGSAVADKKQTQGNQLKTINLTTKNARTNTEMVFVYDWPINLKLK